MASAIHGLPLPLLIGQETAILNNFVALLKEEQRLLIAGAADQILALVDQKSGLVSQLSEIGQRREAAFKALNVSADRDSVADYISTQATDLQSAWHALMTVAAEANQINATNGKLINTRLQNNQQALNVLMTAGGGSQTDTYGPDGHQRHGAGARTLGSA